MLWAFGFILLCSLGTPFTVVTLPTDQAAADNMAAITAMISSNTGTRLDQAEPITSVVESLSLNVYADVANPADRQQDMELELSSLKAAAELTDATNLVKRELSVIDADAPVDEDFDMEVAEIHVFRPAFRYSVEYAKKVQNQRQRQQQLQQFG